MPRLLFVLSDTNFFLSHRLPVALAARDAGFDVHVATPGRDDGDKISALRQSGFEYHPIPLVRGGMNPFTDVWTLVMLMRLFKRVKPDLLHLVAIKPVIYGGIAARLTKCPSVVAAVSGLGDVFSRNGFKAGVLRFFVKWLYRTALRHPKLYAIFQNNDNAQFVSHFASLSPQQFFLIRGSGVNLAEYKFSELPPNDTIPIAVLPARLLKSKGVVEFVEAARMLGERGIKIRCALVGMPDTENPETLKKSVVESWVAQGIVEHWGVRVDMPTVFAQSSLVVLPSYAEGLPKALIEAQSCGRAVVTTDCPGCRDAITPNVTGLLVPPRDARALADAIEHLLNDRERLRVMGKAGRELAEREFDVRGVVDKHLEIYRKLLTEKEML